MAVLPRLIHEAGFFATGVVEKSGRAALEAALDPLSCRQQGMPNTIDQRTIAGAFLISAGQHDEQRGRVHSTVILAERHFAQGGHFAAPCFVHDLARLRIAEAGVFLRLCGCEKTQHAGRKARIEPQRLQRGDDRVPPERRGKPGNARIRVRPGRQDGGE